MINSNPAGMGKDVVQAVLIAALSALLTKGIELAVDEFKERRRLWRDARQPAPDPGGGS